MPGAATSATNICGRVVPESRAGTQSHSSIHERQIAPRRCPGELHAVFLPRTFAGINTANIAGVVNVARRVHKRVISSASSTAVWSFHNTKSRSGFRQTPGAAPGRYRRRHRCGRRAGCVNANPDHSCALSALSSASTVFSAASIDSM